MSNSHEIDDVLAPSSKIAVHFYKLPPSLKPVAKDITEIGVRELSAMDDIGAAERSQSSPMRMAFELTILSFAAVKRGTKLERLHFHDGSAERAYNALHPRVRQLLQTAYAKVHGNDKEDTEAFLEAHHVEVL